MEHLRSIRQGKNSLGEHFEKGKCDSKYLLVQVSHARFWTYDITKREILDSEAWHKKPLWSKQDELNDPII